MHLFIGFWLGGGVYYILESYLRHDGFDSLLHALSVLTCSLVWPFILIWEYY